MNNKKHKPDNKDFKISIIDFPIGSPISNTTQPITHSSVCYDQVLVDIWREYHKEETEN